MTWLVRDRQAAMRMLGAVVVLAAFAGLYYVTAAAVEGVQQQKEAAERYRHDNAILRREVGDVKRQQQELINYLEGRGETVPSDLGGTGPARTTTRIERRYDHSDNSDNGADTTVIVRPAPSAPTRTTTAPKPPPSDDSDSPPPVVRVPDLPKPPKVKVPDVPKPRVPSSVPTIPKLPLK